MNEKEMTPEEMRAEMYRKLAAQQGPGEHLCEVAMPGVYRPVNQDEV